MNTDTPTEEGAVTRWRQRLEGCFQKPRNTKGQVGPPEAGRGRKGPPQSPQREPALDDPWISDWPLELQENSYIVFS